MYRICNIYTMEQIETVVWVMVGFISTLVIMEAAWRIGRRQGKSVSISKSVAIEQKRRRGLDNGHSRNDVSIGRLCCTIRYIHFYCI